MPSQDDRMGDQPGPVLNSPGYPSGPLPYASGTRSLSGTSTEQGQTPATGQLTNANITRVLTATLPRVSENTSQRVPVVIKGTMKRPAPAPSPLPPDIQKQRRLKVTLSGLLMLALIIVVALFSTTPLGRDIGLRNPLAQPGSNVISGQNSGVSDLIAQATATAVYHRKTDGYDPSFFGSQLVGDGSSSLAWPVGQCTYWANYEYHRLTGYWVSWNGNADQWVAGARRAGWNVSTMSHEPSIVVIMPYKQHAGSYGHVAVVEDASDNIVHTSNMNWYGNGGGWNKVSNVDFTVGSGVYFIWHN